MMDQFSLAIQTLGALPGGQCLQVPEKREQGEGGDPLIFLGARFPRGPWISGSSALLCFVLLCFTLLCFAFAVFRFALLCLALPC